MTKQPLLSELSDEELRHDIRMHGPDWWWRLRCDLAQLLIGRRRFNANREIWARLRGAKQEAEPELVSERTRLRAERRERKITQKQVGVWLGCDDAAVNRFELHGVPLPFGKTEADYRAALEALA